MSTSTETVSPTIAGRGFLRPARELRATILPVSGLVILVVLFGVLGDNFLTLNTANTVLREASEYVLRARPGAPAVRTTSGMRGTR